jgi:hypothetical protein
MSGYYDDNFGAWEDMNDPEMVDFYHQVQKESEWKTCKQCEERVSLRRNYVICNSCADQNERF